MAWFWLFLVRDEERDLYEICGLFPALLGPIVPDGGDSRDEKSFGKGLINGFN